MVLENENTRPGRGLCLEPHDCVASKLVAGRPKDYEFASALVIAGLIKLNVLAKRVAQLDIPGPAREDISGWLDAQQRSRTRQEKRR